MEVETGIGVEDDPLPGKRPAMFMGRRERIVLGEPRGDPLDAAAALAQLGKARSKGFEPGGEGLRLGGGQKVNLTGRGLMLHPRLERGCDRCGLPSDEGEKDHSSLLSGMADFLFLGGEEEAGRISVSE
ncbi:MAG: hypothetical protein D6795_05230 [Deltaproteobacteria bacterium]|nr:MAG: hypothetical protein D6795_05230 [Deltaproteobacteria bacterium]